MKKVEKGFFRVFDSAEISKKSNKPNQKSERKTTKKKPDEKD